MNEKFFKEPGGKAPTEDKYKKAKVLQVKENVTGNIIQKKIKLKLKRQRKKQENEVNYRRFSIHCFQRGCEEAFVVCNSRSNFVTSRDLQLFKIAWIH